MLMNFINNPAIAAGWPQQPITPWPQTQMPQVAPVAAPVAGAAPAAAPEAAPAAAPTGAYMDYGSSPAQRMATMQAAQQAAGGGGGGGSTLFDMLGGGEGGEGGENSKVGLLKKLASIFATGGMG